MTRWALEAATNRTVLRLHVDEELTRETIETSPPAEAPSPLDRLFELEALRSLDLHRYRARLSLRPDADPDAAAANATAVLTSAWGPASPLAPDAGPRVFTTTTTGDRRVAESAAMAEGDPLLAALFAVEGVSEAIVGEGIVLVRLGRLFDWARAQPGIERALQAYSVAGGMPGSTSPPV
ncbi:MAG: hypothetical protein ACXVQJ_09675 [Actinomycetota bacterium]